MFEFFQKYHMPMEKLFCVFKIVIGPLNTEKFWGKTSEDFVRALRNSPYFPRGFSMVVTLFRNKSDKSGSTFFVRAGLKLRRMNLTESAVKEDLEDSLRKYFPSIYHPSVHEKVPLRVEGRKESGWNRRCQRLLAAEGRGPTSPTVAWSILLEDMDEFVKVLDSFEGGRKK